MERTEIRTAVANLSTRTDLLTLLNRIKVDELGDRAFPFTVKQFNYFCNPNKCSRSYKTFTIPKKSGEPRVISAPTHIHKSMLTFANRILQACYDPSDAAMGFIPERSVVDNARRHVDRNYVLNLDMKDFFPSISQARVWAVLQLPPFNMNTDVASAFAGMCCMRVPSADGKKARRYDYVLPQGSPASPMLTNIVCQRLDRRLSGLAKRFGLRYTRYADDITFSSDHNVYAGDGEFMTELRRIIEEQHFTINESKTRLQKRGSRQEVTGLVVSDKVNVVRKYTRALGSLLYIWERYGYSDANIRFMANYSGRTKGQPSMERVIQGKLMYLRMVRGENDNVYKRLESRFETLLASLNSSKGAGVDMRFTKRISDYEKGSGNRVEFRLRKNEAGETTSVYAVVMFPDPETKGQVVTITKSCRGKVEELLNSDNTAGLEALKSSLYISLYEGQNGGFWRIQKCSPSMLAARQLAAKFAAAQASLGELVGLDGTVPTEPTDEKEMLSTEEVIDRLIESDGDLNILDRWDMIKKS